MFYVNNKQVKGIFLNGRNYNYLAFGFGKIIPEDRTAEQLNLNLAGKCLNKYIIEFGSIKDGYDNALVTPRFDRPDSNGIFHSPFTYYYGGNIVPTKNVPVYINNGYSAIRGPVYNDINVNGNIVYFAANADFQGHKVNVFPEKDSSQSVPLLKYEMLDNCSNFDLNISTRFSKAANPALYNCNNFSGNFRYVGNSDVKYPGFRGFLYECKDGVFNINCTNMHGGGSGANVTNYYNFMGIQSCSNINLNITGSSWQVWPHDHSFSSNCNINTFNVISGFGYMNDCNFNVVLPKDSKTEMTSDFAFLSNAENCNYNLNALDANLFNYGRGVEHTAFFDGLNNCNLNLLVNNTVSFDYLFGDNLHNCNIVFDNIKADLSTFIGWYGLYNCNISGNVESKIFSRSFIEHCNGINVNINAAKSSKVLAMWECHNVKGNLVCGDMTYINHSAYQNLKVSRGSLNLVNVAHSRFNFNGTNVSVTNSNNCMFEINNSNNFAADGVSSCNFNMRNSVGTARLNNLNNVDFVERGGANYTIAVLNNCYNSWISANTVSGTIGNAYNTRLELKNNNPNFNTWRVDKCELTGFPTSAAYTTNCTFNASLPVAAFKNSSYLTWNNVWPHATPDGGSAFNPYYRTKAGLASTANLSRCYLNCNNGSLVAYGGSITFNNTNNMQTDIKVFYNGTVTANLPIYNMNIKLNVDCRVLNLGIFQAGPPHGFQNATISANDIYAKGNEAGGSTYVQVNCDTKIYCENYCNVPFYHDVRTETNVLQPVLLINNYQHSNSFACNFNGGICRIGRLNFRGGMPADLNLGTGAFVFINNATLGSTVVKQNSVLFLGSNVTKVNGITVESGGLVVNKANWSSHAVEMWSRIDRGHLAWNVWDSGPWGSQSLFDYCINV